MATTEGFGRITPATGCSAHAVLAIPFGGRIDRAPLMIALELPLPPLDYRPHVARAGLIRTIRE